MDTPVASSPPIVDVRWEVAQKVAASASFHRSPRLRELLLYICDRALQNRPADLREQLIGCAVFGRKPDYNPGEDNIVRVEIRQLRKRLDEYFTTEGKDEPFTIVIPKGAYVPAFEPREIVPVPATTPADLAPTVVAVAGAWMSWAQRGLIGVLAITCLWLWQGNREAKQRIESKAARTASDRTPIWPLLFNPAQQTFVICADSSLVTAQHILHRSVTLEEYVSGAYLTKSGSLSGEPRELVNSLRTWQFTDITDVRLVQRLFALNADHWDKVSVRSARTAQIQDFKNGNSILLGSVRSNIWNRLFEPLLNFVFEFDEQTRTPFIRNKTPLQNEQPVYRAAKPGESGETYSILALVPNLRHTGSVLIIAGTSAESTEASGEFIMNKETSRSLIETVTKGNQGRLPYFEVLLKSSTLAGVAKNAEIVAFRTLRDEVARN